MPLNIKDPQTERSVRELAAATGVGVTATIREAVEEKLLRLKRGRRRRSLKDELLAIGAHCAALPDIDTRSPDEIIGYDEHGAPL